MEEKIIKKVIQNLTKIKNLDKAAVVHALVDIEESFDKIYNKIIPQLTESGIAEDLIQDLLWDIREELRHIDYHIHETRLLEL